MQRVLRSGFGRSWIGSRVASAMRWGGAGFKAGQVRVTGSTMASHSCSAGLKGGAQCGVRHEWLTLLEARAPRAICTVRWIHCLQPLRTKHHPGSRRHVRALHCSAEVFIRHLVAVLMASLASLAMPASSQHRVPHLDTSRPLPPAFLPRCRHLPRRYIFEHRK